MISAVFDSCVLYSASLRDFLLRLGIAHLVMPFWSEEIHNEWMRNLLQKRPNLEAEKLERTRRKMDFHFPSALVHEYEFLIPTLQLPDSNDRHVLAVAIQAKAEYIVTFNLKDFPKSALLPHNVEAISPDDFVLCVIDYDTSTVITAVRKHRLSLKRPPKTVHEYLATLEKQGLPKTVAFLREHESEV